MAARVTPYREDEAKPANIYGAHKLEMEQRVLDRQPDSVMLRAEWMYDYISPRGNYLLNVLNAEETLTFGKQYRGITYLREVCENMERVIKLPGGVYNFGSETTQSMYEITKEFCVSPEAGSKYKKVLRCIIFGWTVARQRSMESCSVV